MCRHTYFLSYLSNILTKFWKESEIKKDKIGLFESFFLKNFECGKITNEYYQLLKDNDCDRFKILINMNEKDLIALGFKGFHVKYLFDKIKEHKHKHNQFISWLNNLGLNEYDEIFVDNGIYNFTLFYTNIADNVESLLNIIGNKNKKDAQLMIANTPKKYRNNIVLE